jgi:hypothetical protein
MPNTALREVADAYRHSEHENPLVTACLFATLNEIDRLRAELSAAIGYMTNAAIDLSTGAPKRTALATIEGGIKRAKAALEGLP